MNQKQLNLYHKNVCTLASALQIAGGNAGYIVSDEQRILEILARNGLELKFTIVDVDD